MIFLISNCRCFGPISGFIPQVQKLVECKTEAGAKRSARKFGDGVLAGEKFGPGEWGGDYTYICESFELPNTKKQLTGSCYVSGHAIYGECISTECTIDDVKTAFGL